MGTAPFRSVVHHQPTSIPLYKGLDPHDTSMLRGKECTTSHYVISQVIQVMSLDLSCGDRPANGTHLDWGKEALEKNMGIKIFLGTLGRGERAISSTTADVRHPTHFVGHVKERGQARMSITSGAMVLVPAYSSDRGSATPIILTFRQ